MDGPAGNNVAPSVEATRDDMNTHQLALNILSWADDMLAEIEKSGPRAWRRRKRHVSRHSHTKAPPATPTTEDPRQRRSGPPSPDSFLTRLRHVETIEHASPLAELKLSQVPCRLAVQGESPQMAHRNAMW